MAITVSAGGLGWRCGGLPTVVNTKLSALVYRLRRARAMALRAELAMTGAQILFWLTLIGALVAVGVRLRRRLSQPELPKPAEAEPEAALGD
jgi:hypothetical protein